MKNYEVWVTRKNTFSLIRRIPVTADSPEQAIASVVMSSNEEAWVYELKPGSIVKPKWAEFTESKEDRI